MDFQKDETAMSSLLISVPCYKTHEESKERFMDLCSGLESLGVLAEFVFIIDGKDAELVERFLRKQFLAAACQSFTGALPPTFHPFDS